MISSLVSSTDLVTSFTLPVNFGAQFKWWNIACSLFLSLSTSWINLSQHLLRTGKKKLMFLLTYPYQDKVPHEHSRKAQVLAMRNFLEDNMLILIWISHLPRNLWGSWRVEDDSALWTLPRCHNIPPSWSHADLTLSSLFIYYWLQQWLIHWLVPLLDALTACSHCANLHVQMLAIEMHMVAA